MPELRITLAGNRMAIKASGEDTSGAFALLDYVLPSGWPVPSPHVHSREDETAYVWEGSHVMHARRYGARPGGGRLAR
mgnify:CR=1 FL=1